MAITFMGYLDGPEEMLSGTRRLLLGCDSASDISDLPTTDGVTLPTGGKTAAPAPWSIALVRGGDTQAYGDGSWESI